MIYSCWGQFRPSKIIGGGGEGEAPRTTSISYFAKVYILFILKILCIIIFTKTRYRKRIVVLKLKIGIISIIKAISACENECVFGRLRMLLEVSGAVTCYN